MNATSNQNLNSRTQRTATDHKMIIKRGADQVKRKK